MIGQVVVVNIVIVYDVQVIVVLYKVFVGFFIYVVWVVVFFMYLLKNDIFFGVMLLGCDMFVEGIFDIFGFMIVMVFFCVQLDFEMFLIDFVRVI